MKYVVPDLLDEIKERYEDHYCRSTITYRLALQSYSEYSPVCDIDYATEYDYDGLCGRLFDLDVSGWEVVNVSDSLNNFISPHMYDIVEHVLVTITLFRKL